MAEETNRLRIRLVTPERTMFEHAATAVELPAKNGTSRCSTARAACSRTRRWRRDCALRRRYSGRSTPRISLQRQLGLCEVFPTA